jgi:hypothetical protein
MTSPLNSAIYKFDVSVHHKNGHFKIPSSPMGNSWYLQDSVSSFTYVKNTKIVYGWHQNLDYNRALHFVQASVSHEI